MLSPTLNKRAASPDSKGLSVRAWAKLNLSLVVTDRRPDGYHNLHTVVAAIDLHDDLHIAPAEKPGITLHCTGLPCPTGPENLVHRAAQLLAQERGQPPRLEIHLHKRIPLGAGLGGGSSDAAACLQALNRLWGLNLNRTQLAQLAAQLGSDVPCFLHGPVAMCTGRGEQVTALPQRCQGAALLIIPPLQVSTAQVYTRHQCNPSTNDDHLRRVTYFLRRGDLDGLAAQGINSLTPTCMGMFDQLQKLRHRIENMGIRPIHMSGSGSCLFTTSETPQRLHQWARTLAHENVAEARVVRFQDHADPFLEVHHADFGNQSQTCGKSYRSS